MTKKPFYLAEKLRLRREDERELRAWGGRTVETPNYTLETSKHELPAGPTVVFVGGQCRVPTDPVHQLVSLALDGPPTTFGLSSGLLLLLIVPADLREDMEGEEGLPGGLLGLPLGDSIFSVKSASNSCLHSYILECFGPTIVKMLIFFFCNAWQIF